MPRRETETERLRRCREQFERALRDNVSMPVAKERIAADARRARLESVRRTDALIAERGGHRAASMQPGQRDFYWHKGQYE